MSLFTDEEITERNKKLTWDVAAAQLLGLEGKFRPYNHPQRVEVEIHHHVDGKITVSTDRATLSLKQDDYFMLVNDGSMRLLKGPIHYDNPFEKILATSTVAMDKLKPYHTQNIWIPASCQGVVPNMATKKGVWIKSHTIGLAFPMGAFNILILRNKATDPFTGGASNPINIFVSPDAGEFELQWLREYLEEHFLMREPSGAFDIFTKEIRKHEEMERRVAETVERYRPIIEANEAFWALRQELFVTTYADRHSTPVTVEVQNKKYTINQGQVFRGVQAGGKKLDLRTLFDKGILEELVEQFKQTQDLAVTA